MELFLVQKAHCVVPGRGHGPQNYIAQSFALRIMLSNSQLSAALQAMGQALEERLAAFASSEEEDERMLASHGATWDWRVIT